MNVAACLLLTLCLQPSSANGDSAARPTTVAGVSPLDGPPLTDEANWSEIARAVLVTAIPARYEDKKHWGHTREIFDGFEVQQRGLELRVRERRRRVNDGPWTMVTVTCPRPEQNLQLTLHDFQVPRAGQTTFLAQIRLRDVHLHGQFEHWVLGVKGVNFDLESDVEVRIQARVKVALQTEYQQGSLLPDLVLNPEITALKLELADINVRRIGRVGGPLVQDAGDMTKQIFEDLLHGQEARVLRKANEAIQKKKGSLRLPASQLTRRVSKGEER